MAVGGNVSGIVSTGDGTTNAVPVTGTRTAPRPSPDAGAHPGDSDR
ncbi:hypothetical protein AB0F42_29965 [Streptomyces buecherae]